MDFKDARDIKNASIARIAQAFTNPVRINLMNLLTQGDASVDHLANKVGQSKANTSAQLKVLLQANLVRSRRDGRNTIYSIASPQVHALMDALVETTLTEVPEMRELSEKYFRFTDDAPTVDDTFLERVRAGEVLLVDVRPTDEYKRGHLPGAISLPLQDISEKAVVLPKDRPIYVYCRGKYCVTAVEAIRRLEERGVAASNLFAGILDHTLPEGDATVLD